MPPSKCAVCLTTVAKRRDAERIAAHLVKRRLAACVQIVPGLTSHYRWKGKVCRDAEFLLVMKTKSSKTKILEREVAKIHPYELPEFVVLPLKAGSAAYLAWIKENT
ncbi:MAG TPA: divalent-cation tolerance protein CutA [bacterium]|nr:divalent-cation tolerance protein CutA [bacterium]